MSSATPLPCHDWSVYGFEVFAGERALILHTESSPGDSSSDFVDIEFDGLAGHDFENVLEGNILFDINELSITDFVERYFELLERLRGYGFPDGVPDWKELHELEGWLHQCGQRCFVISSSFGMWGFVLARSIRSIPRTTRYTRGPSA